MGLAWGWDGCMWDWDGLMGVKGVSGWCDGMGWDARGDELGAVGVVRGRG